MKFLNICLTSFFLQYAAAAAIGQPNVEVDSREEPPLEELDGRSIQVGENLEARGSILPLAPSVDPFYQPPAGFGSKPVGTILRYRKRNNPYGVVVVPVKIKDIWQLLVRSEDSFGNPIAIATTVYVPYNADPNKVLSYQSAEDSANIDCAPSYAYQLGSNIDTIVTSQLEQIFSQAGLGEGWYVVSPDYEGPKAAFGAGILEGKAVLNSVRALLNSAAFTGVSPIAKVAYWGYSGGTIATGWASLLAPTYAPDLTDNNIGFALGGIVADLEHTAEKNMGTAFAGLIFAAINGLCAEYPDLNSYVNKKVFPQMMTKFRTPTKQCLIEVIPAFIFNGWSQYFVDGAKTLYSPEVKKVTSAVNMVTSKLVPKAPMFFYNSKFDEIIPAKDADALYNRLCPAGVSIFYEQSILGDHITQFVSGSGSAFSWIKDRLNGKSQKGCDKKYTVTNVLAPGSIPGFSNIIITAILTALQKPIGPVI
ncbi:triacylglycerol lipase [[Candida] anglica]